MTTEIKNAIIESVRLGPEDHGILTAWLMLDYGGSCQGFGGWNLGAKGGNYTGEWITGCLRVTGVDDWSQLPGRPVRVKRGGDFNSPVEAIGHIVKDEWFEPRPLFEAMQRGGKL